MRIADPQIDATVERMLGSHGTLQRLIEGSAEEASKRAQAPPAETSRRVSVLRNQEHRVKDAYVEGAFGLSELKKRVADIQGEIAVLTDLMGAGSPRSRRGSGPRRCGGRRVFVLAGLDQDGKA